MNKSEDLTHSINISSGGGTVANGNYGSSSNGNNGSGSGSINWPNWPAASQSGAVSVPVTGTGPNGTFGLLNSNGQPYLTSSVTAAAPMIKKSISYVIVQKSGTKLELVEQQMISPREMIGICKFVNSINLISANQLSRMNWTELMKSLKIEKHFQPLGNKSSDCHYIELHDPS